MKLDTVLEKLGHFGSYQRRIYGWLTLSGILSGAYCVLVIVELFTPKHRCKIEGLDNDTYAIQSDSHAALINTTIPAYVKDGTWQYDKCHVYSTVDGTAAGNRTKVKCTEWVYDKSVFTHTFTSQIDLVCDDALKTAHISMIFYFGVLVGDVVIGMLADYSGRRIGLYVGVVGTLVSSVVLTWVPEFYSFAILQFLIGGFAHSLILCKCVISFEIVGFSKRVLVGCLDQSQFAVGVVLVPFVAYFVRDWAWINMTFAFACIPMLALWWLVPECARWLISMGRHDDAMEIVKKTAEVNNVQLGEDVNLTSDETQMKGKIWHIFSHSVLLKRTLILSFNWMILSMTYFGVQMNAGNMGGDFYLNFLLMGLAEFPGYLVGYLLIDRIGRRYGHAGSMFAAGLACLSTIFVVLFGNEDHQPITIALAFIGKAGSSMAFAIAYIFTAELLPTVVRNASMGVCSCAARVGAMVAPYIAKMGESIGGRSGQVAPLVVFGILSIIAGLFILLLPETLNQTLPDTIEEGIRFGNKKKDNKNGHTTELQEDPSSKPEAVL